MLSPRLESTPTQPKGISASSAWKTDRSARYPEASLERGILDEVDGSDCVKIK